MRRKTTCVFIIVLDARVMLMVLQFDKKGLEHRREINKKTRSGDKKLRKQVKEHKNVHPSPPLLLPLLLTRISNRK